MFTLSPRLVAGGQVGRNQAAQARHRVDPKFTDPPGARPFNLRPRTDLDKARAARACCLLNSGIASLRGSTLHRFARPCQES